MNLEDSTAEIQPAENINLKMTMVIPKIAQAQNIPTQNSNSINDDDDPEIIETMPNIEISVQKLKDFPIEFNFSNSRKNIRTEYLTNLGFDEPAIKKMFMKATSGYLREEGVDEAKITTGIKKYDIYID